MRWSWQGYDALTPVRDGTCRPVGSFFVSAGDPKGCRGRAESPLQAAACKKIPAGGLTRRLRRGRWGCRPVGAVLSFEAKESTKESTRHGDYGKKALIAHFDGGARYVARTMIGLLPLTIVRAPNSPFSAVKMGGPFSLRCLSPLCSPAVGVEHTQMAVLGMLRCSLDIFATQNASVDLKPRWHFYASRRAYRPTAVFPIQLTRKSHQTGEP